MPVTACHMVKHSWVKCTERRNRHLYYRQLAIAHICCIILQLQAPALQSSFSRSPLTSSVPVPSPSLSLTMCVPSVSAYLIAMRGLRDHPRRERSTPMIAATPTPNPIDNTNISDTSFSTRVESGCLSTLHEACERAKGRNCCLRE